jgi:hypothetical protein
VRRPAGRELHRPGHADADGPDVGRREPGLAEHLLRQPVDLCHDHVGALGDVDRVPDRGQDLRRQVGDGDVDAAGPEVHRQHAAGAAVELQQGRRPAPGAPAAAALGQEVRGDELVDPGADRVPGGTGERDQVRPAARTPGPHVPEQRGRGG